jgi:acyl-CoA synthetase (AMP-forming)/AMP-acid ligase II
MSSLPQLIRSNVQLHGDAVATRFQSRERSWRAAQERVARLAAGLCGLCIGEGDRVKGMTVSGAENVYCKSLIAGYKCPKSVEIPEEPLPLSGAGKSLKKDLRAPHWEGHDRNVS